MELHGRLNYTGGLTGNLSAVGNLTGGLSIMTATAEYGGPYEFTPTQDAQTISISNRVAVSNIIINPIPNNYGLITWNGATLTVS